MPTVLEVLPTQDQVGKPHEPSVTIRDPRRSLKFPSGPWNPIPLEASPADLGSFTHGVDDWIEGADPG